MKSSVRIAVAIALATTTIGVAAQSAPLQFEVSSVKVSSPDAAPNFGVRPGGRFVAVNQPLIRLIGLAYQMYQDYLVVGGPSWIRTLTIDIDAKAPEGVTMGALATDGPRSPVQQMLAALLEERFGLKTHYEKRDLPAFELRTARADDRLGPNLKVASGDVDCAALQAARQLRRPASPPPPGQVSPCLFLVYPGRVVAGAMPLVQLASFLSSQVNRQVIDRTPFTDRFDFDLTWVPEDLTARDLAATNPSASTPAATPAGPTLTTAIQEQLGLRLQSTTAPTNVLVIDSASALRPD